MLARIDGGQVAEIRNLTIDDVPVHKRDQWRPVVDEGDGPELSIVVEASQVRRVRSYTQEQMKQKVNIERDKRLTLFRFAGKDYNFDADSRQNISDAYALALAAVVNGAQPNDYRWADADEDFTWIAYDNTSTLMDAQTTLAFGQAAASWKADHIRTARAIKDIDPVPVDYTDDSRWPTA